MGAPTMTPPRNASASGVLLVVVSVAFVYFSLIPICDGADSSSSLSSSSSSLPRGRLERQRSKRLSSYSNVEDAQSPDVAAPDGISSNVVKRNERGPDVTRISDKHPNAADRSVAVENLEIFQRRRNRDDNSDDRHHLDDKGTVIIDNATDKRFVNRTAGNANGTKESKVEHLMALEKRMMVRGKQGEEKVHAGRGGGEKKKEMGSGKETKGTTKQEKAEEKKEKKEKKETEKQIAETAQQMETVAAAGDISKAEAAIDTLETKDQQPPHQGIGINATEMLDAFQNQTGCNQSCDSVCQRLKDKQSIFGPKCSHRCSFLCQDVVVMPRKEAIKQIENEFGIWKELTVVTLVKQDAGVTRTKANATTTTTTTMMKTNGTTTTMTTNGTTLKPPRHLSSRKRKRRRERRRRRRKLIKILFHR